MNQSLPMCEKLFKHVGEFRAHTTEVAMAIVDEMHSPGQSKYGGARRMEPMEKMRTINEKGYFVYMDEEDSSLYLAAPQSQSGDPSKERRHWVFEHENILYKFANPNEFIYTASDQAGGGDTGQGNISLNVSMDRQSNIHS